jgi:outer membrane protein assembly factor BamD
MGTSARTSAMPNPSPNSPHVLITETTPTRTTLVTTRRARALAALAARLLLGATLASAPVLGCSKPEPKTGLSYTQNAKRAYDEAMEEFNAHNWLEAQNAFREVKRKYGYSKYARLAELRIADADFEQEKYAEAIRGYRQFVHDHRTDVEEVSYARSKIAEAQYREIAESFLLPTSSERDQAVVLDAYRELRGYLHDYPESKESERVRELLAEVTGKLIEHELYVARFYLHRDNYQAAVLRVEYALRNYTAAPIPGIGRDDDPAPVGKHRGGASSTVRAAAALEAEALLVLGETYLKLHDWKNARESFSIILSHYERTPLVVQAKNYLEYMRERGV